MNTANVLSAIPYTEPATFSEWVNALPEKPEDWRELFEILDMLEGLGLVEVDRASNDRIDSLQLTEDGAAHVREMRNK